MCVYCSGNLKTQEPMPNKDFHTVWTIEPDKELLGIVTCTLNPQSYECKINFCPMCGRNLKEEK